MARADRQDGPGALHHVFNRGLARRTMFESRADKRFFLSLLARSVRRGEIRVLAYCVMTTHYHLLVISVLGCLDVAMRRIQTDYSRYFNRTRKRDGPLVRGRFSSKRVDCHRYREAVLAYIEMNPVEAGMSVAPAEYEFSSAFSRAQGSRRWVESCSVQERRSVPPKMREPLAKLVEARLFSSASEDPLNQIWGSTPKRVLDWMQRKAILGDGTQPGQPICYSGDIEATVEANDARIRDLARKVGVSADILIRMMKCGLLRRSCGLRYREISDLVDRSISVASTLIVRHERLIAESFCYARLASELVHEALVRGPFGMLGNSKGGRP